MKRFLIFVLLSAALLSMAACDNTENQPQGVAFYYRSSSLSAPVLQAEIREDIDPAGNLEDILRLYLLGPQTDTLNSPFRRSHKLLSITVTDSNITLLMTKSFAELTGIDLIIACSCLAKTVLELTDTETVTVCAEDATLDGVASITLDNNSLLLTDQSAGQ